MEVECGLASFDREFKAGFWSTVVLPFNVNEEQMAEIKLMVLRLRNWFRMMAKTIPSVLNRYKVCKPMCHT